MQKTSNAFWLSAAVAAMALGGCSSGPSAFNPAAPRQVYAGAGAMRPGMHVAFGPYVGAATPRGGGWVSPAVTSSAIIYGASYNGGFINIYPLQGNHQTAIGQLTNSLVSPQGMVVDSDHRLWVANTNAGNIVAFKRGATAPFRTLSDSNEYPVSVAVDESGNVYAANAESTTGPPGNVVIYKRGATTPSAVLTYSDFNIVLGLGVDAQGNLYVSYIGTMGPTVMEFPKGSHIGQPVNLSDDEISDIIFDDSNDLLMADNAGGLGVWLPAHHGIPVRTIPAFGNEPTFNSNENKVWVALANPNTPEILGYDVSTGTLIDTITNGYNANAWPYGIAIDPRASLGQ